ncbi:ROK family protein [Bifidobacterium choerinum]|uniref:NagC/XylR-type transciptional regulator n=1 Tax=Bifidobacterium choerinum TaxID=35760 RepID=A0A087ADC6_9BIFI|nr:ROK family protein [Bifidobacterium choerinum]KFI56776.1 NagC/XylR-type transciptional regulator [Bifidobacterium choerinum]
MNPSPLEQILLNTSTKTVPSDIRGRNTMAAFNLLFPAASISRSELGKTLGLSRMAATEVTGEMLDNHIIREVGEDTRSGRGKRSVMLAIDTAFWRIITIDLSQQYVVQGALVDLGGRIIERTEIPVEHGTDVTLEIIIDLVQRLKADAVQPILGVGVAVPGVVDRDGTVVDAVQLGWEDVPLHAQLREALGMPVLVGNATNAALVAERFFGEGGDDSMLIRIGAGVGASLCLNGQIIDGATSMAGEIGHVVVDPEGPACACGKRGCLEAYLSTNNLYAQITADPAQRTEILTGAGQLLGRVMAMSLGLLNLRDVTIDAPADIAGETFIHAMRGELSAAMNTQYMTIPLLHRCQVGADASLRGQAINVLRLLVPHIRELRARD